MLSPGARARYRAELSDRLQTLTEHLQQLRPTPPAHPVTALTPQDLLLDALASYRLTRIITTDQVTAPLRNSIITKAHEQREEDPDFHPSPITRSLAYFVTCDYCVSIYTSTALALIHITPANTTYGAMLRTARYALATAGAVSAFREVLDR